ncbi:MAG: hypothetical protein CMH54_06230 [Myxococcales bacterium]|nr:hypothetical protein [Myxococcales bacterium]
MGIYFLKQKKIAGGSSKLLQSLTIVLLSVFVLAAGGCGETVTDQTPILPGTPGTPMPDTGTPPPTGFPNLLSFHQHVASDGQVCTTACVIDASAGMTFQINIRYTDWQGVPLPNGLIQYQTTAPESLVKLLSNSSVTQIDGTASVTIQTGAQSSGTAEISITSANDPQAGVLRFFINLDSPNPPVLTVSMQMVGSSNLPSYNTNVYATANGQPSCATVHPDSFEQAIPTAVQGPLGMNNTAVFQTLPGTLPTEDRYYTVQVVGPASGAITATGCLDNVPIRDGVAQQVQIVVDDLPLKTVGVYNIDTYMDMVTGTKGNTSATYQLLTDLFNNPGELLVTSVCENAGGFLGTICGLLTNSNGLSPVGYIVAEYADQALLNLMADMLGQNTVFTGQSLTQLLSNIRFASTMVVSKEAVPTSQPGVYEYPKSSVAERWDRLGFYWQYDLNCPPNDANCGFYEVELTEVLGVYPQSSPNAGTIGTNLWIEDHDVPNFNYALILDYLIEKEVLPRVLGDGSNGLPVIDTFEKMVAVLFGGGACIDNNGSYLTCCANFSQTIGPHIPPIVAWAADPACQAAIGVGGAYLRNEIMKNGGNLSIGTPSEAPCPLIDIGFDRITDTIGMVGTHCQWDATFYMTDALFEPISSFWGERTQ